MSYLNLLAQWDQKYGQAYTLESLLPRVMPKRPVPSMAKDDPLRCLCAEVRAMGLPLVMDPSEDTTETGDTR